MTGATVRPDSDMHPSAGVTLLHRATFRGIRSRGLRPWLPVAVVSAWTAWTLRATLTPAAYLDDASMHQQMVRVASRAITQGRNPLTMWFPYLGEGSPQFMHYQSLGAIVTGLFGTVIGPDTAFRWSVLLLVSLWPVVIFVSARVFGLPPWTAAIAAVVSPFVVSVPRVGFEHGAYIWIGYGVWAQLWASWTLPLALACSWRAMENRRFIFSATLFTAATIAFHFETGYIAVGAIVVFPWLVPPDLKARLRRSAVLAATSFLASAWVVVPVILFGKWAAINEVLRNTPLENGYGARKVTDWLVTGRVFDAGHLPYISVLVGVGVVVAWTHWKSDPMYRALLAVFVGCLLVTFGRTTFGEVIRIIPGSSDLFFRRFLMGTQLAGLYLAGVGGMAVVAGSQRCSGWLTDRICRSPDDRQTGRLILTSAVLVLVAVAAYPAFSSTSDAAARNSLEIRAQRAAESQQGPQIGRLIDYVERKGGGRVYAGLPTNWGATFTIGAVPVFKYLESRDVDEVGYTLRTASLMTDPEYYFDEANPGDYMLFGIRYLLLPDGRIPPVSAVRVMQSGAFVLWRVESGYYDLVETVGRITADRSNIADRTRPTIHLPLIQHHQDLVVSFAGSPSRLTEPGPRAVAPRSLPPPGVLTSEHAVLTDGVASVSVRLTRKAVVMLSASFDPGWKATIDGHPSPTMMLAPAVIGVVGEAGHHRVVFTYKGFPWYPELGAVAVLALAAAGWLGGRRPRPPRQSGH